MLATTAVIGHRVHRMPMEIGTANFPTRAPSCSQRLCVLQMATAQRPLHRALLRAPTDHCGSRPPRHAGLREPYTEECRLRWALSASLQTTAWSPRTTRFLPALLNRNRELWPDHRK